MTLRHSHSKIISPSAALLAEVYSLDAVGVDFASREVRKTRGEECVGVHKMNLITNQLEVEQNSSGELL